MCTWIVQIVFIVLLAGGAIMTIISLTTPAWKQFNNVTISDVDLTKTSSIKVVTGLFSTTCGGDGGNVVNKCADYFKQLPAWQKAAMACLIIALLACAAAFVWSCIACFMCCCKTCLMPPLPILAGLACLLDIIGITIFGVKSGDQLGSVPLDASQLKGKSAFGYSFWVGIGAIIDLFLDTLVGIVLVKTSKVSPI